jgi:hypothetical protein
MPSCRLLPFTDPRNEDIVDLLASLNVCREDYIFSALRRGQDKELQPDGPSVKCICKT